MVFLGVSHSVCDWSNGPAVSAPTRHPTRCPGHVGFAIDVSGDALLAIVCTGRTRTWPALTLGWHGTLLPGFGCGGDRAAHWGHLLCPGAPAATASHRAGRKGFSTHSLSLCIQTEAICSMLTMAGSIILRSWLYEHTLIFIVWTVKWKMLLILNGDSSCFSLLPPLSEEWFKKGL